MTFALAGVALMTVGGCLLLWGLYGAAQWMSSGARAVCVALGTLLFVVGCVLFVQ